MLGVPMIFIMVLGEAHRSLFEVCFIDYVVAVKDRPCFVPGYFHCYLLRHSSPHHIPYGRSPEVVEDPSVKPCIFAGLILGTPEIVNSISCPEEHIRTIRKCVVPYFLLEGNHL